MDAYSQLKPLHHADRLMALSEGIEPAPVHVQLILSDLCNQDCHFCAYRMSGGLSTELFAAGGNHNPNRKINTKKALDIVRECANMGVKAIQFTGGGEPTVHPDFLMILETAQAHGMHTGLVTNGVKLHADSAAVQNLDWIRISVDAGTPETYMSIRRVNLLHWNKVWANIEQLRGFDGHFGVGFVVTNENYSELPEMARRCVEYRVPYLRIGAVFSKMGMLYYDSPTAIHKSIADAKKHQTHDFEIVDLFGRRLADLENTSPEFSFCGYQYFTTYIGADLNVYRCCNTAYTKHGLLDNLNDTRLADISRDNFDARSCEFCQFLGQNRAINGMLHVPQDVDFV